MIKSEDVQGLKKIFKEFIKGMRLKLTSLEEELDDPNTSNERVMDIFKDLHKIYSDLKLSRSMMIESLLKRYNFYFYEEELNSGGLG